MNIAMSQDVHSTKVAFDVLATSHFLTSLSASATFYGGLRKRSFPNQEEHPEIIDVDFLTSYLFISILDICKNYSYYLIFC